MTNNSYLQCLVLSIGERILCRPVAWTVKVAFGVLCIFKLTLDFYFLKRKHCFIPAMHEMGPTVINGRHIEGAIQPNSAYRN